MGTFHVTTPACDGGVRPFSARLGGHAPADDGHEDHHHGAQLSFGTPIGSYPDLPAADDATRARLETLRLETQGAAAQRFPTYQVAVAAGFTPWRRNWRPPLLFHLRHARYERDRHRLDPRRPESLVYWWGPTGQPVLVAFMYRMPMKPGWPRVGRPLLGWHAHGADKPGATLMTHVWLTGDLRSAIANCMPVAALEAANPAFRFQPTDHDLTQESVPCLDAAP